MPRSVLRRIAGPLLLAAGLSLLVACGDAEDASLCDSYQLYAATLGRVLAADPTAATAAAATNGVEDVLATVSQLRAATDGRYAGELGELETSLDDLRATLESVEDTADYATWQPLVNDTMQDVVDQAVAITELMEPQCNPGS